MKFGIKKKLMRLLSITIIASLVFSIPLYADTGVINHLEFKNVEKAILEHNPDVKKSGDSVATQVFGTANSRDVLQAQINALTAERDSLISFLGGLPADIQNPNPPAPGDDASIITYINKLRLRDILANINSLSVQLGQVDGANTARIGYQQKIQEFSKVIEAEQKYIGYNQLTEQINNTKITLDLQKSNFRIMELQNKLGMQTNNDILALQADVVSLEATYKQLQEQQKAMVYDFNIMLGQKYDTPLTIGENPRVNIDELNKIDFEKDFTTAKYSSYMLKMYDIDSYDYKNEVRKLEQSFEKAYHAIEQKKAARDASELAFRSEEKKYEVSLIKFKLGMISRIQLDQMKLTYENAQANYHKAEDELFIAYNNYQWILKGITL